MTYIRHLKPFLHADSGHNTCPKFTDADMPFSSKTGLPAASRMTSASTLKSTTKTARKAATTNAPLFSFRTYLFSIAYFGLIDTDQKRVRNDAT